VLAPGIAGPEAPSIPLITQHFTEPAMNHIQPSHFRSFTLAIAAAVLTMQCLAISETQAAERVATATGPQGQTVKRQATKS
jgi:hypothetical protein